MRIPCAIFGLVVGITEAIDVISHMGTNLSRRKNGQVKLNASGSVESAGPWELPTEFLEREA
jgi:hypothetical protein